jgi:hypothetical protein
MKVFFEKLVDGRYVDQKRLRIPDDKAYAVRLGPPNDPEYVEEMSTVAAIYIRPQLPVYLPTDSLWLQKALSPTSVGPLLVGKGSIVELSAGPVREGTMDKYTTEALKPLRAAPAS